MPSPVQSSRAPLARPGMAAAHGLEAYGDIARPGMVVIHCCRAFPAVHLLKSYPGDRWVGLQALGTLVDIQSNPM